MDNLFKIRTLTTSVNKMVDPSTVLYNRYFRGKGRSEITDRLAWDIITGGTGVLDNISIESPATVTDKTGRSTVTLEAPRIAQKRHITAAEVNAIRRFGSQQAVELMSQRIAREQKDMLNVTNRTLEFWAAQALKGKIYKSNLKTVIVDYNLASGHRQTKTGDDLWTSANSDPINQIRTWKRTIEDDSYANIISWDMWIGHEVMDALLVHADVLDLLKYERGTELSDDGRLKLLAEVNIMEYTGSWINSSGTRKRFIDSDQIVLVGVCDDFVDLPYAPIVQESGQTYTQPFFSKSWIENDPSGRWIFVETRQLPVLKRPGCIIVAKIV